MTKARFPLHVTKRVRSDVTRLRRFELCAVLRRAFVLGCRSGSFRICQFSIQGNHIHLICEASDRRSLARGIQGWSVRVARGLNGHLGRRGSLFDDRYHVEILTTRSQTRNALCYVMKNRSQCPSLLSARNIQVQLRERMYVGTLALPRTALLKACKQLWPPQVGLFEDPQAAA
jgi:REP element-mobilizing transposase RayT